MIVQRAPSLIKIRKRATEQSNRQKERSGAPFWAIRRAEPKLSELAAGGAAAQLIPLDSF